MRIKVQKFPKALSFDVTNRCLLTQKSREQLGLRARGDAVVVRHRGKAIKLWAFQGVLENSQVNEIYLNPPTREELDIPDDFLQASLEVDVTKASFFEKQWLRWKIEKGFDFLLGFVVGVTSSSLVAWLVAYTAQT
ncbi:MAG: hypothetical protein FJ039_01075 [Chloroflexi bacterium]|nr:hypothetical protein [Chloroflexota bacterium]